MRLLVTGGRAFFDTHYVENTLDALDREHGFSLLIHGDASGADTLADKWAESRGIERLPFPIDKQDWLTLGRSAGPTRNARMLAEGRPELVVAFPGGSGTHDMVKQAKRVGVRVIKAMPL